MRFNPGPVQAQGALIRQVHGVEPRQQAARVLSIDGGGVRGIMASLLLAEIERRTSRPVGELFDVVAGTSIGAVLAVGTSVPGPDGNPRWQAQEGFEILRQRLPKVFERSGLKALAGAGGVLRERYDEGPVEDMLHLYFGDHKLSEAVTNVIVPAYDLANNDVLLFDSLLAASSPDMDLLMREVVRGATAAPTYFEPKAIGWPTSRYEHLLVDGGLFANNPGMCALVQAQRRWPGADIVMVSLGAGSNEHPLPHSEVKSWGLAHWARPIFSLVMDSASQATHHYLQSLLGDERYFRFDPKLGDASHHLDDASSRNLDALERAARQLIASSSARLDRVCALLVR